MNETKINTIYGGNIVGNKPPLRIIKLGAEAGANRNLTVYECGDDIVLVDCGFGFPDSEILGVDVVIPDITYLLEHRDKVRGLLISHAHEDHFGAVPYIIDDFNVPIYASKLTLAFINERLKDHFPEGRLPKVSMHEISSETPEIKLGCFSIKTFGVNHSVPGGLGFAIKTPQGVVMHISDYKMDWTPVLDKPIELGKIAEFGDAGVLCLLSDCLGVTTEGYAKSEVTLNETFHNFIEGAEGRQIFITTISSNISRMYQIIQASIKHGRRVVFSGRSMVQSSNIARSLGYLPFNDDVFVTDKQAMELPQDSLLYIIAGCYGQTGSGLDRLARGEHNNITMAQNALVLFSADPNPPGVQEPVERLLHNLTVAGAEVIYSAIQDNLHVSGHGLKGDIGTVTALSKAKYYVPIGGTAAKMRAYTYMAMGLGAKRENVYELLEGESVVFDNGAAKKGETVEVKPVYISGKNKDELSPVVIKDREQLSNDGVFVVMIPINSKGRCLADKVEIVTRGFIYVKDSQALMDRSKKFIRQRLNKLQEELKDWTAIRKKLERELEKSLMKETGRVPLIIVHTMEI